MAYSLRDTSLLFLLLRSYLSHVTPDQDAERAALLKLQETVGRNGLPWNQSTPICSWRGVTCTDKTVVELRLPGTALRGTIPPGVFGNLTALRKLSLRSNVLSGLLPADIASCTKLKELYLQENRFSGDFPAAILSLTNLTHLVLSGNAFAGQIRLALSDLKNLTVLKLDRNQFSGQIPDLDLPNLAEFNVSFNRFNGSVPHKLRGKPADAFLGMSLCGGPFPSCPGEDSGGGGGSGSKNRKLSGAAIAGIAIACAIGSLTILAIVFVFCLKRRGNGTIAAEMESGGGYPIPMNRTRDLMDGEVKGQVRGGGDSKKLVFLAKEGAEFELEALLRASAELLGKGTFGTTYKASLESGEVVVVKRLKEVELGEVKFVERVEAIGAMEHSNLLALKAYYYSNDEKLLIYPYMPMGSFSRLLHGNKGSGRVPLSWSTRFNMALTVARGIEYIHSKGPEVCHGNIKSSNILLNQSYDVIISDHALVQLAKPTYAANQTIAYLAPEVRDTKMVTQKADVYSFGILLLEMLTGKEPGCTHGACLLGWVLTFPRDDWSSEVFDMELLRFQSAEEEMVHLLQLAIDCCARDPGNRPTMSTVVIQIVEIQRESLEPVEIDSNDMSPPASNP